MSEANFATKLASFLSCSTSFLNLLRHMKPLTTIIEEIKQVCLICVLTFLYHAGCLVDYLKHFYQPVNMPVLQEDLGLPYLVPLHLGRHQYLAAVGSCCSHCDLSSQRLVTFHKFLKRGSDGISLFTYACCLKHTSVTKLSCDILVIKFTSSLSTYNNMGHQLMAQKP